MVVAGRLNVELCAALRRTGLPAVGLHAGSGVIRARRRPPRVVSGGGPEPIDFGLVGDVVGFDTRLLDGLWRDGYLPVLSCLGLDDEGEVLNLNADLAASQLAAALAAHALVAVTAVGGVRSDAADPATRLPRLTVAEARAAIADGRITGGMIPKLEEACAAIAAGVRDVRIVAPAEIDLAFTETRLRRHPTGPVAALEIARQRWKLPPGSTMSLAPLVLAVSLPLVTAGVAAAGGRRPPEIVEVTAADVHEAVKRPGARAVLVNVWATWCEPCKEEMPDILRFFKDHKRRGLRLVLVSTDPWKARGKVASYLGSMGVDFPSYLKRGQDDMAFIDGLDPKWDGTLPASLLFDGGGKQRQLWSGKVTYQALASKLDEVLGTSEARSNKQRSNP